MKKRTLSLVLALLMIVATMVGCAAPAATTEAAPAAEAPAAAAPAAEAKPAAPEKMKLTYIVEDLNNEFFSAVVNSVEYACAQLDIECSIVGSSDVTDAAAQVQFLENCIASGQDAIILGCSNSDGVAMGVKAVQEAGIPVVCVESGVTAETAEKFGFERPPFYGSDSYQQGTAMAEWVLDRYPQGTKMILLEGQAGSSPNIFRLQAWNDHIAADYYDVVGQQNCNWVFDDGYDAVQNLLLSNPDVKFIAAFNDSMALGAQAAVRDAGLTDQIEVMGMNGDLAAVEALRANSNYVMTIGCQPGLYGLYMVNDLYEYVMNGKALEADNYLPVGPVTPDTVEEYAGQVVPFYEDNYTGSIDDMVPDCQW